ncbi:DUF3396 domain-containing protein [Pasteurella atlantica]|uniref:DUF3396 domain-containing protein n=1 Tax=Phocoenobacter skyensis TaxID=97481 RepID=A0AAJ6P3G8_9PAST|nr:MULTISPECIES: type VI immunity family protein [Pasteurella]MDP8033031.1 DUF3396 domain-containing protein [Pasteurella atlantica]MDP8034968.1 DUF3396 domain-containing protein [Pasteurella atlantica]MDP8037072.1 DUF3396 domain-containing protein [Pasteurella atlantica]MDP8047402.1 DUF3396 domain-containing protein [Pasteurella atlantica]MDP8049071.1 DUF3396 domain-containing protein [Pasteurella atlantica]
MARIKKYLLLDPTKFEGFWNMFQYCNQETNERKFLHVLKRIDWLTFINHRLIDKLGGIDTLTKNLTIDFDGSIIKDVILHKLPHGICVQAGAEPIIGDISNLDYKALSPYRHIGSALKPVTILQNEYGYDVKEFNFGGMSGGGISSNFWIEKAFPLLIKRYKQLSNRK